VVTGDKSAMNRDAGRCNRRREGMVPAVGEAGSHLRPNRAKTLGGLLTRVAAKVAAYTCAQRINNSLGRPLRNLVDLLI
jgi:hypothetical protein